MITHEFQGHRFECYSPAEFAAAGLKRTHRQVSNSFTSAEGPLLARWLRFFPDAVLVANGKRTTRITVFAPKKEKKRAARRKIRCGSGDVRLEGLSGALSDRWAFYDVLNACRRRLKDWEDAGILSHQRFDTDFIFKQPGRGSRNQSAASVDHE